MRTSRSEQLLLLLAVMTMAVDARIVKSTQQYQQDEQDQDQQEQWLKEQEKQESGSFPAPGPDMYQGRTYALLMPLYPWPHRNTSHPIQTCPSCPEPRCLEPVCPEPLCPAPIFPPCPKVSCPPHVCPNPVSPACPPPPACPTQPPPAVPKCSQPQLKLRTYDYHRGFGFYKVYMTKLTWHKANATCSGDGAHLGIINSEKEAEIFRSLYRNKGLSGYVFLGYHDLYKEGDFRTVLGGALSDTGYTKWASSEPNNLGNNEDCGTMNERALLNDDTCEKNNFFICEVSENVVLGIM